MRVSSEIFMVGEHPIEFFCCCIGSTGSIGSTVQAEFVKTSISIPSELFSFLKAKAAHGGGTPISRLVAQAIKEQAQREKTKPKKGGVK
jgi:hypothetical protein